MSNVFGQNIKISIFGESHGVAIGMSISGLPAGFSIDFNKIDYEMARRAPGQNEYSTTRKEKDKYEILSGVVNNKTAGSPLCIIIRNENTISKDYEQQFPRPGHADLVAFMKYKGYSDYRGGGHFSGRLTAPLVFIGAIAKQILNDKNIIIGARIKQIYNEKDRSANYEQIIQASKKDFPVHDDIAGEKMKHAILEAKSQGDSVGGIIQCVATGVPIGLGEPFFDSLESEIAKLIFSIPAVKGIEFGLGFGFCDVYGSTANDPIKIENNEIKILSNNNGGINGGISNGNPIDFSVIFKPTPSISKEQTTIDLEKMETITITFEGRHDPCIVLRAVPVVEACLAICLLDFLAKSEV